MIIVFTFEPHPATLGWVPLPVGKRWQSGRFRHWSHLFRCSRPGHASAYSGWRARQASCWCAACCFRLAHSWAWRSPRLRFSASPHPPSSRYCRWGSRTCRSTCGATHSATCSCSCWALPRPVFRCSALGIFAPVRITAGSAVPAVPRVPRQHGLRAAGRRCIRLHGVVGDNGAVVVLSRHDAAPHPRNPPRGVSLPADRAPRRDRDPARVRRAAGRQLAVHFRRHAGAALPPPGPPSRSARAARLRRQGGTRSAHVWLPEAHPAAPSPVRRS